MDPTGLVDVFSYIHKRCRNKCRESTFLNCHLSNNTITLRYAKGAPLIFKFSNKEGSWTESPNPFLTKESNHRALLFAILRGPTVVAEES